jgi:hypothetical protein
MTLAERHAVLIVDTAGFGDQAAAVAIAGAENPGGRASKQLSRNWSIAGATEH